jgi:hypothetical protein
VNGAVKRQAGGFFPILHQFIFAAAALDLPLA